MYYFIEKIQKLASYFFQGTYLRKFTKFLERLIIYAQGYLATSGSSMKRVKFLAVRLGVLQLVMRLSSSRWKVSMIQ